MYLALATVAVVVVVEYTDGQLKGHRERDIGGKRNATVGGAVRDDR